MSKPSTFEREALVMITFLNERRTELMRDLAWCIGRIEVAPQDQDRKRYEESLKDLWLNFDFSNSYANVLAKLIAKLQIDEPKS